MNYKKLSLIASLATLGITNSHAAIEEIMVSATKRDTTLAEVPFSVQALSGGDVEDKGVLELRDVVKNIPGAGFGQTYSPNSQTVSIRGVATFVGGSDPTTGYYLDDFAFVIPGLAIAPPVGAFDLERIEVIRSPQGTLYGASAMGGIIKYVTADPDASAGFGGKIQLSGSDYTDGEQSYGSNVALNIPLIEDVLAARLTATYKDTGGFIDNPTIGKDDENNFRQTNVRGKLLYTPDEDFSAKLSVWYNRGLERNGYFTGSAFAGPFPDPSDRINPTVSEDDVVIDSEMTITSLALSWDLGFATLEESLSYTDYKSNLNFDISNIGLVSDTTLELTSLTNELKLVSNPSDSPWSWIAGTYYSDIERDNLLIFFGEDASIIELNEWAVFGELTHSFMDGKVDVLLGLRYAEIERDLQGEATSVFVPGAIITDTNTTFETLNPRFNITMRPTEDTMVFLNIAKGFRSGFDNFTALTLAAQSVGIDAGTVDVDELWTYEVGTKSTFLDGNLYVDASVYYTDWEQAQWSVPVPGSAVTVNVGDIELYGLDLMLSYQTPIEGLSLGFSGNINHAEWASIDDDFVGLSANVVEGERVPSIPRKTARISLDYTTPINDGMDFLASAAYSYSSRTTDISLPGFESGAQQIMDVQIGIESPDDWKAILFVKNLGDEDEFSTITQGFATLPTPREIGVRLSKEF